jgi:hypothetical protein
MRSVIRVSSILSLIILAGITPIIPNGKTAGSSAAVSGLPPGEERQAVPFEGERGPDRAAGRLRWWNRAAVVAVP